MKMCSVCGRISGTGRDHTDCVQRRRIELEEEDLKGGLPEKLNAQSADPRDLGADVRAILEQLAREKDRQSDG